MKLDLRQGEILGLLGARHSGVDELLDSFEGLVIRPPGPDEFMPRATVAETVALFASLYPRATGGLTAISVGEAIARAGLGDRDFALVSALAAADRAHLALAVAAAANAPLVLLSEPTAGLDPEVVDLFAGRIGALRTLGRTIVVASGVLDGLAPLCDRVAVVQGGKVVAVAAPQILADRARGRAAISFRLDSAIARSAETLAFLSEISTLAPVKIAELREGAQVTVYVEDGDAGLRAVTFRRGLHASNVRAAGPSLDNAAIFYAPIRSAAEPHGEVR